MNFCTGDVWRPKVTWKDPETKALVEPTTTTAEAISPVGTTSKPTTTKVETAVWRAPVPLTESGKWKIIFTAAGAYVGVKSETITVYAP